MSWDEVLDEEEFSVLIAPQTDANTEGSAWVGCDATMPEVSYDAAQTDVKRARRSHGASTKKLTGRVWPKLRFRWPMCGQLVGYNYASATPALQGANKLIRLGGSAALTHQLAGINPSAGKTLSLVTSPGKMGCLVAGREASGLVRASGFVKTSSGAGPYVTGLFEDMRIAPGAGIPRIPSLTLYTARAVADYWTVRLTGASSAMERLFIGAVLSKLGLTFDADWRPWWSCELTVYGGERRGSSGGLQPIVECLPIDPLVERGGARFVVASNVFGTLADGTVDPDGTCDVRDLSYDWTFPHYVATKPTGLEGVKEVIMRSPQLAASFAVPDTSDFEVSAGVHFGEAAWRNNTPLSLSAYLGDTPGQIVALNTPAGEVQAFPEPVFIDGVRHRRISIEAGHYAGDDAATDAGNKVQRLAVA